MYPRHVTELEARFSLVSGEGDGAMLGLAAGDTAGGAWELGYAANTQQATVVAYHLIENGGLDTMELVERLRELDGSEEEEPVYRAASSNFRRWLDGAAAGSPVPEEAASIDTGPRAVPLGVVHRRDPEALRRQAVALGTLFSSDARSVLGGVVVASAVAASCFGQSGRDLIRGLAEVAAPTVADLKADHRMVGTGTLESALVELTDLIPHVGVDRGEDALAAIGSDGSRQPWDLIRAGLLLAAPVAPRDHLPIEQAARIGGSDLGAIVGGIVGSRVGIRAWPWAFANDTWFAEVGRRLARGPAEVSDLPIPYAVEQHLNSGERRGFH
jgi:hypothetical protein